MYIPFLGYLFSVLRWAEGGDGWLSATAFGASLIAFAMHFASGTPYFAAQDVEKGSQPKSALIDIKGIGIVQSAEFERLPDKGRRDGPIAYARSPLLASAPPSEISLWKT